MINRIRLVIFGGALLLGLQSTADNRASSAEIRCKLSGNNTEIFQMSKNLIYIDLSQSGIPDHEFTVWGLDFLNYNFDSNRLSLNLKYNISPLNQSVPDLQIRLTPTSGQAQLWAWSHSLNEMTGPIEISCKGIF